MNPAQPEALRLADLLRRFRPHTSICRDAANELERLNAAFNASQIRHANLCLDIDRLVSGEETICAFPEIDRLRAALAAAQPGEPPPAPESMSRGVFGKYILSKASGEQLDPEACYFVLRLDTDEAAQLAAMEYARHCKNRELARDVAACVTELRAPCSCRSAADYCLRHPRFSAVWHAGELAAAPTQAAPLAGLPEPCAKCDTPDRCATLGCAAQAAAAHGEQAAPRTITPSVAQRLEPNQQSAHEVGEAEAAPEERLVSNQCPTDASLQAGPGARGLASAAEAVIAPQAVLTAAQPVAWRFDAMEGTGAKPQWTYSAHDVSSLYENFTVQPLYAAPAVQANEGAAPPDGQPPYPEGEVIGPCVCGSWPGGKCLHCPWIPAAPTPGAEGAT